MRLLLTIIAVSVDASVRSPDPDMSEFDEEVGKAQRPAKGSSHRNHAAEKS